MKKLSLVGFIVIIYMVFVITGYTSDSRNVLFSMITMGITLLMVAKTGLELPSIVLQDKVGKLLLIFLSICFLVLSVTSSSAIKYVLSRYNMFFPIIIYIYFVTQEKDKIKPVVLICLIIWTIISIRSVYMYSTGQVNARDIISQKVDGNYMTGGGYGITVGSAFLLVYLLEMIMWKRLKKNIFNILFIILLLVLVFYTQSTITIIAVFFGLLCAVIFKMFRISNLKSFGASQIIAIAFVIVGGVLIFLLKENIGNFLINVTDGKEDIVFIRLNEVGVFLKEGTGGSSYANSDIASRVGTFANSIDTFLKYPLFGAMMEHGSNFYVLQEIGVGSHGEFLDAFGLYGIVNAIPYLGMFFGCIYRERKNQKNSIGFGYVITIMILMFFNPFNYAQSNMALFFIIPMLTMLYNSKETEVDLTNNDMMS